MVISKKNIEEFFAVLAVSVYLNGQFLRTIIEAFFPVLQGQGLRIVFIFSIVLLVLSLRKIVVYKVLYLLPLSIILYYALTQLFFSGRLSISFIELLNYVIFPFFFIQLDVQFEKVVKYTLIITSPAIILTNKIFILYGSQTQAISMLLSYSVLFSVLCAFSYLLYYRKRDGRKSIFYFALCAIQVFYFIQIVAHGARGAVLSLVVFFIMYFLFNAKGERKTSILFYVILIVLLIIVIVIIVFQNELIEILYSFMRNHNISIRAIEKIFVLSRQSNITNGRIELFITALKGIAERPLFGNGISMFLENTGYQYPHNIFLQLTYDGGIILLGLVTIPIVIASTKMIKSSNKDIYVPWLVLFSSSVPGALFSGDIWMKYTLWYFCAFCLFKQYNIGNNKSQFHKLNMNSC